MKIKWSCIEKLAKLFPFHSANEIEITTDDNPPQKYASLIHMRTPTGIKVDREQFEYRVGIRWLEKNRPDIFKQLTTMRLRGEL